MAETATYITAINMPNIAGNKPNYLNAINHVVKLVTKKANFLHEFETYSISSCSVFQSITIKLETYVLLTY